MTARTNRWRGIVAFALFAGGVGLVAKRPSLLLLAVLGVGFATYPRLVPPPDEPDLEIERTMTPERPAPSDRVTIEVTLRNTGTQWLFDLRFVDGVPSLLQVVDGTPRLATALPPGAEATVEYAIAAERGKHRFGPATVLCRDVAGAVEHTTTVSTSTVVDCASPVPDAPVRGLTRRRPGPIGTDDGGSGIEFHRTREYRPGDPSNRVDWRRFARTGELSTIEFRAEQSVAVVLCIDVRVGDTGRAGTTPSGVARCVAAADRLADALARDNHEVGLAAYGRHSCWLSPTSGIAHVARLRRLLETEPAFATPGEDAATVTGGDSRTADDGTPRELAVLRERLGAGMQVMFLTPLVDDGAVRTVLSLERAGHPATVVSPDVTTTDTPGSRIASLERSIRIQSLRGTGVPVLDWRAPEGLGDALDSRNARTR